MRDETKTTAPTSEPRPEWPTARDGEELASLEQRARRLDRQARAFIRDHPATVVLGAVAIGFLVGRMVRA